MVLLLSQENSVASTRKAGFAIAEGEKPGLERRFRGENSVRAFVMEA